jgi:hypothetical protein
MRHDMDRALQVMNGLQEWRVEARATKKGIALRKAILHHDVSGEAAISVAEAQDLPVVAILVGQAINEFVCASLDEWREEQNLALGEERVLCHPTDSVHIVINCRVSGAQCIRPPYMSKNLITLAVLRVDGFIKVRVTYM